MKDKLDKVVEMMRSLDYPYLNFRLSKSINKREINPSDNWNADIVNIIDHNNHQLIVCELDKKTPEEAVDSLLNKLKKDKE